MPAPTERFSDRVDHYVRHRPSYPTQVLDVLRDLGLGPASVVADVGSGTGISTELLLRSGARVYAIEPNADMRRAAEEMLGSNPNFASLTATAEATTLPSQSFDYVVAMQAFHWFDRAKVAAEFRRVLKPGGRLVLVWNDRRTDSTPFLRDYEALLLRFGTDYATVRHSNVTPDHLRQLFGGPFEQRTFDNHQDFDFPGLRGRLLSSSYTPPPAHPSHAPMLARLREIFDAHQRDGHVRFAYDTSVYFGTPA